MMEYPYLLTFPNSDLYVQICSMEDALELLESLNLEGVIDFILFNVGGNGGSGISPDRGYFLF